MYIDDYMIFADQFFWNIYNSSDDEDRKVVKDDFDNLA